MRRRGAPTLYELTKSGGRGSISGGSGGLSGGSTPSVSLLGNEAARSVRVPVGFLWLLGVAVLGFAALTYAFGVGRGRAAGFAEGFSAKLSEDNTRAMARTVNDPMKQGAASVSVTPQKPFHRGVQERFQAGARIGLQRGSARERRELPYLGSSIRRPSRGHVGILQGRGTCRVLGFR